PHLSRMAPAAGQDEAAYPAQIGLLGTQAVVPNPQPIAHLIQQLRPRSGCYTSIFLGVIHTPAQQWDNTTSIDAGRGPGYQVSE
ncbi:hypothetical protein LMG919_22590, partial [Xanthomonas vesicatoria]